MFTTFYFALSITKKLNGNCNLTKPTHTIQLFKEKYVSSRSLAFLQCKIFYLEGLKLNKTFKTKIIIKVTDNFWPSELIFKKTLLGISLLCRNIVSFYKKLSIILKLETSNIYNIKTRAIKLHSYNE